MTTSSSSNAFDAWHEATANLSWGVQRVFYDTLSSVNEGKVTLVYGANYNDGSPCLVNATAAMLTTNDSGVSPIGKFPAVVSAFYELNRELESHGINDGDGRVSPLAAEFLLRHFGHLKDKPIAEAVNEATESEAFASAVYREPSDADLARDWLTALSNEPCEPKATPLKSTEEVINYGPLKSRK